MAGKEGKSEAAEYPVQLRLVTKLAGTLEVGSISMIPTMVRISVWVFDEVHHRVVGGKIIQRIDVGVVKVLMQVFMKISLHVVSETAKRCQPKVHDPEERRDLHILVHDRPRTFKHERKTTPGNRNVVWLPVRHDSRTPNSFGRKGNPLHVP